MSVVALLAGLAFGLAILWVMRLPGWMPKVLVGLIGLAALVPLNVYDAHRIDFALGFAWAIPYHVWAVHQRRRRPVESEP